MTILDNIHQVVVMIMQITWRWWWLLVNCLEMESLTVYGFNWLFSWFQFHFGYKEKILFDQWDVDSIGGFIASFLVIAVMASFYEGLKYYREYLFWKTYNNLQYRAVTLPDKAAVVGASNEDTAHVK